MKFESPTIRNKLGHYLPIKSDNGKIGLKFGVKVPRFHKNAGFNVELSGYKQRLYLFSLETSELDMTNYKAKVHLKIGDNAGGKPKATALLEVDVPAKKFVVEASERYQGQMRKVVTINGKRNM